MTFTIIGFCPKSGKAGFATSTSTPAVGWRPARVVLNRGIVALQAFGDYRKLLLATRLMEEGHLPGKVLKDLSDGDEFAEYRQTAVLDFYGRSAVYTGKKAIGWAGEVVAPDHIATGNVLAGRRVPVCMAEAFKQSEGEELEERLMRALEAGRDAGGQPDGQTSSVLVVYGKHEFPLVDLRVDVSLEPIGELRGIFSWYKPLIPFYTARALDPTSVARYKAFLQEHGLPINPFAQQ